MSRRGRQGRQAWQQAGDRYAQELTAQIAADADQRWHGWAARGRVPWWIRLNRRLRGQGRGGASGPR